MLHTVFLNPGDRNSELMEVFALVWFWWGEQVIPVAGMIGKLCCEIDGKVNELGTVLSVGVPSLPSREVVSSPGGISTGRAQDLHAWGSWFLPQ